MAGLSGASGSIKWSYYTAADVERWAISRPGPKGTPLSLVATLKPGTRDLFKLSQRPLVFVALQPAGPPWRWPILELSILENGRVTARLGPELAVFGPELGPARDLWIDLSSQKKSG